MLHRAADMDSDANLSRILDIIRRIPKDNLTDMLNFSLPTPHSTGDGHLSTVEALRVAAPTAILVDRILTPIWYTIGLIGNPITMKIWLSKRMRKSNSSAIYIGSIAVVHFVYLLIHLLVELHVAWGVSTYNAPVFCEIYNFLHITPQYLAPLLTLGFTTERYIAVCLPFRKEQFCTVRRACIMVGVLTVLSFLFGSLQTYIWTYHSERDICILRDGAKEFYEIWTWISEMLIFAFVPMSVLVLNVLVIREIRRLTKRPSFQMYGDSTTPTYHTSTVTLLSVSFYLICTLLPVTIVYSIQSLIPTGDQRLPKEEWASSPAWDNYLTYYTVRKIVEEICFSNYACNIFIYYITGSYFRQEVHKILCFRLCEQNSNPSACERRSTLTKSQNGDQYTLVSIHCNGNGKRTSTDYSA